MPAPLGDPCASEPRCSRVPRRASEGPYRRRPPLKPRAPPRTMRRQALTADERRVWVATSAPSVSAYDVPGWTSEQPPGQSAFRRAAPRSAARRNQRRVEARQRASTERARPAQPTARRAACASPFKIAGCDQQPKRRAACPSPPPGHRPASLGRSAYGASPSLRLRQSMDFAGAGDDAPAASAPAVTIPSAPGALSGPTWAGRSSAARPHTCAWVLYASWGPRHAPECRQPRRPRPSGPWRVEPRPPCGRDNPAPSPAPTPAPAPAALVSLRVLPNKRHILTQDSRKHVALWDVLRGSVVEQLGVRGPGRRAPPDAVEVAQLMAPAAGALSVCARS